MTESENIFTISEIYPPINEDRICNICDDFEIPKPKKVNITKLPEDIENKLIQLFVKKSLKDNLSLKYRFLQYIEYLEEFQNYNIELVNYIGESISIDYQLKEKDMNHIKWLIFTDYLEIHELNKIKNSLSSNIKIKSSNKQANSDDLNGIFIICGNIDRKIALESNSVTINGQNIPIEYFLEYEDPNRPFMDEDILEIDDIRLKGFNFGSIEQLLDALKKLKGMGKYEIYSYDPQGIKKKIWEGYVFPDKLLKK